MSPPVGGKPPCFLEDVEPGQIFRTDSHDVGLGEMLAYAGQNDPQPFHLDATSADQHPLFRGLSASGFYTLSVTHRLLLAGGFASAWGSIGKGIDRLRWPRPVRCGDRLRVEARVIAKEAVPEKAFGIVRIDVRTLNHHDDVVLAMIVQQVVPKGVTT